MFKNIPEDQQDIFAAEVAAVQPQNYKCPETVEEYWSVVDEYWAQLIELINRFSPLIIEEIDSLDFGTNTLVAAEVYRRNKDKKLVDLFGNVWSSAPDDGRIHLLSGWSVLCDLCSESYLVYENN